MYIVLRYWLINNNCCVIYLFQPVAQTVANILDSSAPIKRGKEREVPKAKKPSPLKKVGPVI